MTRETRLSPRRAPKRSGLPLSPRRTQVRLKPLLFLRPRPPKGGKPRSETPRFRAHCEHPFFDARLRSARIRLCPTARLQRKSTVCGLNRLRPSLSRGRRIGGPLDLNPRPVSLKSSRLLHLSLFAPCQPANCRFRFGKKNCNANQFFSPNRNPSIPGERQPPGLPKR